MQINVRYGVEEVTKEVGSTATIGDIRRDYNLKATLGYSDNVNLLVHGVSMPDDAPIPSGSTVVIETRANQKALVLAS